MLCFYVAVCWRGMLTVEYDSGLDVVFSKVQLKAVMGVFGTRWSTKHLKAFVKDSSAFQQ